MKVQNYKKIISGILVCALASLIVGATVDTGGLGTQTVVVVDEKAANTAGGTFTSGAWQTRPLNTFRVNDDTIASLSSDQITFPAGTSECWISAPAFKVKRHMIRLQNITGAATITTGSGEYAFDIDGVTSRSWIKHKFTLSVSSVLEIQHRCETTRSSDGFGLASNFSVVETYAIAMLRKAG